LGVLTSYPTATNNTVNIPTNANGVPFLTCNPQSGGKMFINGLGGIGGNPYSTLESNQFSMFDNTAGNCFLTPTSLSLTNTGFTTTSTLTQTSLTVGSGTGLMNGSATLVQITSDDSSGTYYIPFSKTSGTGSKTLYQDDTTIPLTYNPGASQLLVNGIQLSTATNTATYLLGGTLLTIDCNNASNREFNYNFSVVGNNVNNLNLTSRRVNGVYTVNFTNSSGGNITINSTLGGTQPNKTSYSPSVTIANGEFWVMTIKVLNFNSVVYNCVSMEKFV